MVNPLSGRSIIMICALSVVTSNTRCFFTYDFYVRLAAAVHVSLGQTYHAVIL